MSPGVRLHVPFAPMVAAAAPPAVPADALVDELRAALSGPRPTLPARWFWGEAARLHRERSRGRDHYPSRVDRELFEAHAPMLVGLFEPRALVDLAPAATRHVRALAGALARARRKARCVLHDCVGPRLVAAVRRLAADFPHLEVSGVLGGEPTRLGRDGGRLLLLGGGGPDGMDAAALQRELRAVAERMSADDATLLSVDLGADVPALVRACRDGEGRAEAHHRAAVAAMAGALGGEVDVDALVLEAEWDAVRRRVDTRLRPVRPVRFALPAAGLDFWLETPIYTGCAATWARPQLRRLATRAGLALTAWMPDADERRALVVLRPESACGARAALL